MESPAAEHGSKLPQLDAGLPARATAKLVVDSLMDLLSGEYNPSVTRFSAHSLRSSVIFYGN